jgi:hypothetical protein
MKRIKTTGVVLLALFAFSAIAATAAQAEGTEGAPYWSIEGTRLAAGKTFEIIAKSKGVQKLTATTSGQVVSCNTLKLKPGSVLLGSNGNEPGKNDETIEYGECSVTGNGSPCEPTGKEIKTEPLSSELAYAENKKSLVVEFTPTTGKVLAKLTFTGTGCTVTKTTVTGQVVTKALSDAATPVLLELPNTVTQAESWLLEAPTTAIRHIWLITAGTGKAVETEELNSFGTESVYSGTALINLAVNGTPVAKNWSPLL